MARISPLTHCHFCWVKTGPLPPSVRTHGSLLPLLCSDLIGHLPGRAASPPGLGWFSVKQCSCSATYRKKIVYKGMDLRHLLSPLHRCQANHQLHNFRKTGTKTTSHTSYVSPLPHNGLQIPGYWRQDEVGCMKASCREGCE